MYKLLSLGRWLVLALALLIVLSIPAPSARWRAAASRPVVTRNPKIGVHTRLTDEVEEWKIAKTWILVHDMGAPWAVEYFPWAYCEPEKGRYDFQHADLVVEYAYAEGITILARLDFVPQWARPKDSTTRYLDKDRFGDFGDFVYAFVSHFRDRLRYFIIWNEPNITAEWGYRPVSPEDYTELLKIAYTRAKEANPQAIILAAGLAPTLEAEQGEQGMSDLLFLQRMYAAGAQPYFDALAIHAYGGRLSPDDPADPDRLNFARAELLREIMVRHGDAAKPAFITEGGWNDHPRWTKAVRPAQRTAYTLRAYEKALNEWPWCQAVCFWAFRYPRPARSYSDYFTFVNADFSLKPIYLEVQRYAHGSR